MNPADGQLVADVLAGATDQFSELVRRYESPLLRAAYNRLGNWDASEEAVQETFCCAFKSLHTYNSAYSFRTWLWTILLNQCRRSFQQRKRRQVQLTEPAVMEATIDDAETPPTRAIRQENERQLHRLLNTLPEADADAVRLRFFGGLKFHEIAAAMQCGLSTAKVRVRRGLERLSQRIQNEDGPLVGRQELR